MSDTQFSLGKLVKGDPERDAVHIAVVAVVADDMLAAGMRVGFKEGGKVGRLPMEVIGIVDPFLTESVYAGDKFWMFLLPNTITSLKHNWTHPAFEPVSPAEDAEEWLQNFADEVGLSYNAVIEAGKEAIRTGDYYTRGEDTERARDKMYEPGVTEKFWKHFEAVTRIKPDDREHGVFSCSC